MSFRALVTRSLAAGGVESRVEVIDDDALPEGNVLVSVEWAGFNYKDGLVLSGLGNLARSFPHVGGIDFAGRVIESRDARYHPGQAVVLTGWRVGEVRWGGFATRARVDADMLVPLPKSFTTRTAMVLGTAGLAAMLAINRLQGEGSKVSDGEVLVTGAGGGVGSMAVMLLSKLRYKVVAVTGRPELTEQLTRLGASRIVSREEIMASSGKVLDKETWMSVVDTVGGPMLGEVLKKVRYGGWVAAVGNAGGLNWDASVIPFLLRNISLLGIDTVMQPVGARLAAWDRLTTLFNPDAYESMVEERQLEELPDVAARILKGGVAGRVIVNPREPG